MGLLDCSPSKTRIKICGLRSPADIEAVIKANVDAIGLVFYPPSPRAIRPEDAGALIGQLPKGVDAIGLVVNPTPNQIEEIRANAAITMWQFHGDETPEQCKRLAGGLPWLKAARIGQSFNFVDFSLQYRDAAGFLLDALVEGYGGGGTTFNWDLIPTTWANENAPRVVLSGGLNAHNVGEAIARLHPCAVDISSGVEISKGVKDPALIQQFVDAVRVADSNDHS
jgi:phosphoribosylanthranilate isomerase